jgi:hypothetical protein
MQKVMEGRSLAEFLVSVDPTEGDPFVPDPPDHLVGQLPSGAEHDVVGDPGLLATGEVGGPRLGKIEPSVQEGMSPFGGVAQVHPDLTILRFPPLSAPLTGDPHGLVPAFGEGGRVHEDHPVSRSQGLANMATVLDQKGPFVPLGSTDEVLQKPHVGPLLQRDGLDRLALEGPQQTQEVRHEVLALVPPGEELLVSGAESLEGKPTLAQFVVLHGPPPSRLPRAAAFPKRLPERLKRLLGTIPATLRSIKANFTL